MLNNKIILITGATHGIGRSIVESFSGSDNQLILVSRNENELLDLNRIAARKNDLLFAADVSEYESINKLFLKIKERYDRLDAVINCAGIFGSIGKMQKVNPKQFMEAISVNLMGTYNMCYFGLPLLKSSKSPRIINFSGGGATGSFPNYSSYACSKIAIVKLTENLSEEYPEILVNCIAPGFIKTRLTEKTIEAGENAGDFFYKTLDIIKNGGQNVSNAVELVKFLLSKQSEGISGKLISAQWDNWKNDSFINKLRKDKDFCTLRRIDHINFYKSEK